MRLPFLSYTGKAVQKQMKAFGGYNRNPVIGDHEFHDMKNMTNDGFPAIETRKGRGKEKRTFRKPNGLFYKNGLLYVDGTELFYKDKKVGDVQDSEKKFVGMGAYVLIWPDKVYMNTSTGAFGNMVKTYQQSGTVTFAPASEGSTFVKISGSGLDFSQFDSVTISGCTKAEFNKTTVIQEVGIGFIVIVGVLDKSFTQASGLKITRAVPDMDYVCESDNRLWGCSSKNHEIYASKLGDPFNWNNFEGISTDSYAVTVGSDGDFTGCIGHMGNVLFFKENTIHKMYGNRPSNFQLNTYGLPGVKKGCDRTICTVNETLFYYSRDGVMTYDGSVPVKISEALGDEVYNAGAAGQNLGKYYITLEDRQKSPTLMVYDPKKQLWCKEDDCNMKCSCYGEGDLYYIDGANKLRTIQAEDTDEKVAWYLESGPVSEDTLNMKYISKLMFHVELEAGAVMELFVRYDGEIQWRRIFTVHAKQRKTYVVPVIPRRCSQMEYRMEGNGYMRLYAVSKFVEEGSEIGVGIQR